MGIFNIKSLKDKYAWASSEDKTQLRRNCRGATGNRRLSLRKYC